MLEEQGKGFIKDLFLKILSKLGAFAKNVTDETASKLYHNVTERGKISVKKLNSLDANVDVVGIGEKKEPVPKDVALAISKELKKYGFPYSIKPEGKDQYKFIIPVKSQELFKLAVSDAIKKQTNSNNSIKDDIFKQVKDKVQAKQNSKEHSRQEPLKHNLRERS